MTRKALNPKVTTVSRERASRFARTHNPLQPPPLRIWHVLLGLLLLGVMFGSVTASGLFGEMGRAGLGGETWQITVWAIEGVAVLCLWALVGVRAMHPLMYLGLTLEVVFLALWLGITRTERLEFTIVNLILLAFSAIVPMRVITRPNDTDRLNDCEARAKTATAERDAALAELARLKGEA